MGIYRIGYPFMFILDFNHLGVEHRISMPRTLWHHSRRRCDGNDLLAGFHQYRHDNGFDAHCWCDAAVYQLWRFIGADHIDLCRTLDEHQHEAFSGRIISR